MITLRFELKAILPKAIAHTAVCVIGNAELANKVKAEISSQTGRILPSDCIIRILSEQGDILHLRIYENGINILSQTDYGLEYGDEEIIIDNWIVVDVTVE